MSGGGKAPTVHLEARESIHVSDRAEVRGLVPLARLYYDLALRAADQGVAFGAGAVESRVSPYVAVFFAFAAAEAYLPELLTNPAPGQVEGLDRSKLERAVKAREGKRPHPLEAAYAGSRAPAGLEWHARLRCLRILRNELVHYKARPHLINEWPARFDEQDVPCRDVIRGWEPGLHDWTSALLVPAVARWACATVRLAIEGLHARVGGAHPWSEPVAEADRWP